MNIITNDLIDAAFDRIWNNLGAALRISLIPFAIAVAIVAGLNFETITALTQGQRVSLSLPWFLSFVFVKFYIVILAFVFR